jgi:hypothetical protein
MLFYSGKLKSNTYYSTLIKVRKGDLYYTADKRQHGFIFKDYNDKSFERFFELVLQLLQNLFEEYENELDYSCDAVLLDFHPVNRLNNLKQGASSKITNLQIIKKDLSKNSLNSAKGA